MADKRRMRVLTTLGVQVIHVVAGSDEASLVGSHWNAIKIYLDTGKTAQLKPFENAVVGGHRLATDPKMIKKWAKQGDLDIDDPYEPLGGDS